MSDTPRISTPSHASTTVAPGPKPAAKAPSDTSEATPAFAKKAKNHPKHGPQAKASPGDKKPKEKQLQPLLSYTGTVGAFGANPDGVYDQFVLEADGQARTVKFPPHFGEKLRSLAQPGHEVTVLGFLKTTPKGDEHLHLARLDAAGTSARPLAPGITDAATVAGTIAGLHHDPKGHLTGLRLADEEAELRLPPHLGRQLAERLVLGAALTASGQRRALRPGEVAASPAPAPVQIELLTVGGETFLLQ